MKTFKLITTQDTTITTCAINVQVVGAPTDPQVYFNGPSSPRLELLRVRLTGTAMDLEWNNDGWQGADSISSPLPTNDGLYARFRVDVDSSGFHIYDTLGGGAHLADFSHKRDYLSHIKGIVLHSQTIGNISCTEVPCKSFTAEVSCLLANGCLWVGTKCQATSLYIMYTSY